MPPASAAPKTAAIPTSGVPTPEIPGPAEMERAYLERDASYNGLFFLGVRTTGIFCRPTCPARKPLPKNVEYFPTAARPPRRPGIGPCKRCRPLAGGRAAAMGVRAARGRGARPRRRASRTATCGAGGSTRPRSGATSCRQYGMTFQAFARARRLAGALSQIREGGALDDAVFESGYESHSGFREAFARTFGDTPGELSRPRAACCCPGCHSPLGPLVAGATAEGVCLLEFTDRRMLEAQFATVRKLFGAAGRSRHRTSTWSSCKTSWPRYFAGTLRSVLGPAGVSRHAVPAAGVGATAAIPYGETRSYEELAVAVGKPTAVRAVGRANGLNRIAILIPCHRVVNKNGDLGGYGGGLRRKQFLDLETEQRRVESRAGRIGVSQTVSVRQDH